MAIQVYSQVVLAPTQYDRTTIWDNCTAHCGIGTANGAWSAANGVWFAPFLPMRSMRVTDLVIGLDSCSADTNIILGIYTNVSASPGYTPTSATLLVQSGTVTVATSGFSAQHLVVAITPTTLTAGTLYWLASIAASTNLQARRVQTSAGKEVVNSTQPVYQGYRLSSGRGAFAFESTITEAVTQSANSCTGVRTGG